MKPDVFSFTDYRSFLKAHFAERKLKNPAWSYQAWAKKLGLKNNTSLLKILHQQRELGPRIQTRLEEDLNLTTPQKSYFNDLVRLSKLKDDPQTAVLIRRRLQEQQPRPTKIFLDDRAFSAISSWWYYAVRQLTRTADVTFDPRWISKQLRFSVPPRDIKRALDALLKLGLLTNDPARGNLRIKKGSLDTPDDVASEGLKRFHEQALENARKSVRTVSLEEREISGLTFAVSSKRMPEMKALIRKFEDEFNQMFGNDPSCDAVYQLELALYPLTHRQKKER